MNKPKIFSIVWKLHFIIQFFSIVKYHGTLSKYQLAMRRVAHNLISLFKSLYLSDVRSLTCPFNMVTFELTQLRLDPSLLGKFLYDLIPCQVPICNERIKSFYLSDVGNLTRSISSLLLASESLRYTLFDYDDCNFRSFSTLT